MNSKIKTLEELKTFWHERAKKLEFTEKEIEESTPYMIQCLDGAQTRSDIWNNPHLLEDTIRESLLSR